VIGISLIITFFGILSSVVGGILPFFIKVRSKKYINFLYEFVSGIMVGIVCISMIPESIEISGILVTIIGIVIGTILILFMDFLICKVSDNSKLNKLILIISSMAFHNIIEGMAVGASIEYSFSFGISIFIAMFLHDIPEGMIVGIANLDNNKNFKEILKNSFIVGLFTGIGVFIGEIFGSMSDFYTGLSLSISAGAMLYIVTTALVPDENYKDKTYIVPLSFILGILVSVGITKL